MLEVDENHSTILSGIRVIAAINGIELFGHERGNIEVFKALRDMGAEVLVGVSSRNHGGVNHVAAELNRIEFETFQMPFGPQWSKKWIKHEPLIVFTNVRALLHCSHIFHRKIKQFQPTHAHLGSPLTYSYLSLSLAMNRIPLVYRMGDCAPADSAFNLQIWKQAMRRSARIVANSKFVKESALSIKVPSEKISIIHNLAPGISYEEHSGVMEDEQINGKKLLYAGSVSEHKGLLQLIEAYSIVSDEFPSLSLDIIGGSRYDKEFRNSLRTLIEYKNLNKSIKLHGHVTDPSKYFKRADVHVAPSIWEEPFANVVLEAKREGIPSVIFPSGGLPEMINHQKDGYICRDKSVDALVEGLRWMLDDEERLQNMRASAIDDSSKRFGKERFCREWAKIYLGVK